MAHMEDKVSLKTDSDGNIKMGKVKELLKNECLETIQKVLTELKIDESNKIFLGILEKLFKIDKRSEDLNFQRLDIIIMFLQMLENSSFDNYVDEFHDFDKHLLSRELRKVTVEAAEIKEYFVLGEGDFGMVLLGQIGNSLVAVKEAKNTNASEALLHEAKIMAGLDHKNVVKLVGFQKSPMRIVMEHVQGGNLKAAIENHFISSADILKALHDVSTGMEYLSGKNIIHNDLDGNNIFVDSKKVCKIGDFGYAKYVGYSPKLEFKGPLQVLFLTPPDTMVTQIFTTKSDVWSFGILALDLYEVAENLCLDAVRKKFLNSIKDFFAKGMPGYPPPKPCPVSLFKYVTEEVLNLDPCQRPTFSSVKEKIGGMLSIKSK
ncbi:tyrosine-protein kinase CSK-like [Anoplophora glabripennis]|uniref:tyrosine-protein kinase CSK-like n=1 Tax=Anoplophora glabripennis TaxID=217634 RepID=UPI0008756B42|nr:tyrosine-protein kinase CSK-like [Anoplophora glabripennis]